jgi:hypothetical protein
MLTGRLDSRTIDRTEGMSNIQQVAPNFPKERPFLMFLTSNFPDDSFSGSGYCQEDFSSGVL